MPHVKTIPQLKAAVMATNGNQKVPYEKWQQIKASNPQIVNSKKRKRYRKYKRGYRANKRFAGGGGSRPIVMQPNIVGYGGYFADAGSALGAWGGRALGGMADTVFGLGDYNVKANSLWNQDSILTGLGPPKVVNTHKGEAVIINHREYLQELTSGAFVPSTTSTAFKLESFNLNPGNSTLFPWLAQIAANFQEYEIRGMLVELKTEAADFSATFNIGSMFMSADYNVLADDPVNKREVENMEYSSSCKPSNSLIMPIECHPALDSNTHLYIAVNGDYKGGDKRLYDLCRIHIGTEGLPAQNVKIAEIWVTFEVALFKPKLADIPPVAVGAHFTLAHCDSDSVFNGAVRQPQTVETSGIRVPNESTLVLPGDVGVVWLVVADWKVPYPEEVGILSPGFNAPVLIDCEIINHMWASEDGIDGYPYGVSGVGHFDNDPAYDFLGWAFNTCIRVTGPTPSMVLTGVDEWPTDGDPGAYGDLYVTRLPEGLVS